jgi:hypothetical protein
MTPATTAEPTTLRVPAPRWVTAARIAVCVFGILLGASQAWLTRNNMSADGISYLDIGSALANGKSSALINGYWSPLYPAIIGAALTIVRPLPQYEFAVVHAMNFAIFLIAFASFKFFLQSVNRQPSDDAPPGWFLQLAGYIIFFWSALGLITVSMTSPDMLMAVFVFLATGFLVRIFHVPRGMLFFGLGLALGFGYLAKLPMFLLSFVYLAIAVALARKIRVRARNVLLAGLTFAIVSVPFAVLLSKEKRRLTFGDSGRLNYAWYVDGATYRHWQGEPLSQHSEVALDWAGGPVSTGTPIHTTRKVMQSPPIFAFGGVIGGTYPVWYDPSYWNEGLKGPFNARQQLRVCLANVKAYYAELLNPHLIQLYREGHAFQFFSPLIILCVAALIIMGARLRTSGLWQITVPVFLPALAAFGMYLLVGFDARYIAAFVAILYLGTLASLRIPDRISPSGIAASILLAFVLTMGIESAPSIVAAVSSVGSPAETEEWQVVEGLRQMGFKEGLHVGTLNYSNHDHVRWARMARAIIVTEIFPGAFRSSEDEFWFADEPTKSFILDTLVQSGAQVIVSRRLPANIFSPSGWRRIGATHYYIWVPGGA